MPHSSEWLHHLDDETFHAMYLCSAQNVALRSAEKEYGDLDQQRITLQEQAKQLNERASLLWIEQCEIGARLECLSQGTSTTTKHLDRLVHGRLPIQDFPPDILRPIFAEVVLEDTKFRWVLTTVCRQWREIAQSTPCLWSRLRMTMTRPEEVSLHAARKILQHGGSCPLYLEVFFDVISWPSTSQKGKGAWAKDHDLVYEFVQLMVSNSTRYHAITWRVEGRYVTACPEETIWIACALRSARMSNLRDLQIDLQKGNLDRGSPHDIAVRALCAAANNLTSFSLRRACIHPIASNILESLFLEQCYIQVDTVLSFLQAHRSLRSIRLHRCRFAPAELDVSAEDPSLPSSNPLSSSIIDLPYLQNFHIICQESTDEFGRLLGRLSCPLLQSAIIRNPDWSSVLQDMLAFFSRAPCLSRLGLTLVPMEALAPVFRSLPSLEQFAGFTNSSNSDSRFVSAASSVDALPALRRLELSFMSAPQEFLTWMQARILRNPALETMFSFRWDEDAWAEESWSRWEGLVQWRGLEWLSELELGDDPHV